MKYISIGIPMGLVVAFAIIVGCLYLWEWLVVNTTLKEGQAGFYILIGLMLLMILFWWGWTYNNREEENGR